jgi:hypothetical protein
VRPAWSFELVRDTNAPLTVVRKALLNGDDYHKWHPRHSKAAPEIIEDGECLEIVCRTSTFGLHEEARYRVEPAAAGGRLLLTYRNTFRGWPIILLMGWLRVRSERVWERFIASLRQEV